MPCAFDPTTERDCAGPCHLANGRTATSPGKWAGGDDRPGDGKLAFFTLVDESGPIPAVS